MIESLVSAWGAWSVFAGLAVVLFVRVWQTASARPETSDLVLVLWSQVPARVRPLIAMAGGLANAAAIALVAGATWAQAADVALVTWLAAAGGQEALRAVAGKGGQ